ncbi:uncharacterized protein LOC136081993 [Hydra vulgaris]|uniref:Uncharacterized protein LOC136081993 n=1 Tax=Hydra vulgaris TaxID=6087 RepID=A0ABM4C4U2_HYDVU
MGLDNYAYEEDHRLGSWDKTLPAFNSMKVDSEYDIKKSNDVQESSLDHNSICFVTKPYAENSYSVLLEKGNHYEALQVTQATIKSKFQNDSRALSCKKTNSLYETTEIEPKTKYRTKQIKGYSSGSEDNSKCIYLVFSVLVAIIAITSAVMVFMILFGVISVQKCKECNLFDPKSEKQTQINTNDNVKLKLQELSEIRNLTSQLNEQKDLILSLTNQLKEQREQLQLLFKKNDEIANITYNEIKSSKTKFEIKMKIFFENQTNFIDTHKNEVSRNISSIIKDFDWLKDQLDQTNRSILNLTLREGIQGPQGHNGSEGPEGKSANFESCNYSTYSRGGAATNSLKNDILKGIKVDGVIVGAFCTSNPLSQIRFYLENTIPICECIFQANPGSNYECRIHFWYCK